MCLINLNKGEDDEGCLKFSNNLKWSTTVKGKLLKGCLESTVRYDIIRKQHKCESPITVLKIIYTLAGAPLNFEALGFSLSTLTESFIHERYMKK